MKSHKPAALAANILKYAVLIVGAFLRCCLSCG